jgi:hypothetical protein
MSALLPPGPRGDRNCCALTTTQTWPLTLEMPSVEPVYSPMHRISRPACPRTAPRGRNVSGVGSLSYAGGQARVVLDESPRAGGPPRRVHRRGTGVGRERHDVGTRHSGHDVRSAPVVAGAARRGPPCAAAVTAAVEAEDADHGVGGRWVVAAIAGSWPRSCPACCDEEERAAVIDLLGLVVFTTVVGIGLLDRKSGLSPFAMYRSAAVTGVRRRASATGRGGGDNQPRPPAPAQ